MKVEVNFEKLKPWLQEKNAVAFVICFASPSSKSKEKIMIELDKMRFYTLAEIERDIGEAVFTITD